MVHYQFKQYKYDYSKSKIPPLDSRRPSGHYRLSGNSPPYRQTDNHQLQIAAERILSTG